MALKFNPATGKFEEDVMDANNPISPMQPESTQPMDPMVKDYLMKKFDFGKYNDEARQKLVEDSQLGFGDKAGAALAAIGAGFMGKDAAAAGMNKLNAAKADKKAALDAFDTGRKGIIEQFDLDRKATSAAREDDQFKRESDPNSSESKMAQELAIQMGMNPEQAKGLTAAKFKDFSPIMQKKYEIAERAKDRAEAREQRNFTRDQALTAKSEERMEKDVQKLSDKLGNAQELSNALDNVNSKLGTNLDDLQVVNGTLKDSSGKDLDLPGVSIPGIGRVSAYSGKARELESAVSKVFNTELKDRSGASVTTPELERLKVEFGSGKFNTEAEMVQALKDYKRMVNEELKNREAGFRPEVVEQYKGRGGATSECFKSNNQPNKIRVSNGKETLEIDESDLSDAEADGYKRI